MQSNRGNRNLNSVYYVEGSGLFAVPAERVGEISRLKAEYHDREADAAMRSTLMRRLL